MTYQSFSQLRFYLLLGVVAIISVAYVSSDSCVQCNSATDPKCATDPQSIFNKNCQNISSKCYTRVLDGNTIRGCASDLDNATAANCRNEMECLICSFIEGCNNNVFPQHRVKCLQCEGNSTNSSCAVNVFAQPTVCPIYKLGDKCYIRNTGKNDTQSFQRGCLSSAQSKSLCVDGSNCYTCEGTGCNFLNATDTSIPLARDSAAMLTHTLLLLIVGLMFAIGAEYVHI